MSESVLVQAIALYRQGEETPFDLSFLREFTYVETLDLSGPRLMFTLNDHDRIIRDQIGVKEREVLKVTLADRFGFDGMDKTFFAVILTMPVEGDLIRFNCMEATVFNLKTPAKQALLFPKKPVSAILGKLAPKVKTDIGSFPALNDYHLIPGARPSKLLRQMSHEYGAVCFWQRGKIVFKKLKDLYAAEPKLTYHHNDSRQALKIAAYEQPNTKGVIKDRTERNFQGWDMVEGLQKSGKAAKAPAEMASVAKGLDNLIEIPLPAIDFTTHGNGELVPGMVLKLSWAVERSDLPIDESLPAKVVVSTVAHRQEGNNYTCRVLGVKP